MGLIRLVLRVFVGLAFLGAVISKPSKQVLREDKLDLYKASPFELKLYRGLSHKLDKHYAEKYGISEDKKAPLKKGRKSYKKTKNLRVLRDTDARTAGRFKVRRGNNKSKRRGNNKSKRKG